MGNQIATQQFQDFAEFVSVIQEQLDSNTEIEILTPRRRRTYFTSVISAWEFYKNLNGTDYDIQNRGISVLNQKISDSSVYVILHTFIKRKRSSEHRNNQTNDNNDDDDKKEEMITKILQNLRENLTPRSQLESFSGYHSSYSQVSTMNNTHSDENYSHLSQNHNNNNNNNIGSNDGRSKLRNDDYNDNEENKNNIHHEVNHQRHQSQYIELVNKSLPSSSSKHPKLNYDIYIWYGKKVSPIVKAVAMAKAVELEGFIMNNEKIQDFFLSLFFTKKLNFANYNNIKLDRIFETNQFPYLLEKSLIDLKPLISSNQLFSFLHKRSIVKKKKENLNKFSSDSKLTPTTLRRNQKKEEHRMKSHQHSANNSLFEVLSSNNQQPQTQVHHHHDHTNNNRYLMKQNSNHLDDYHHQKRDDKNKNSKISTPRLKLNLIFDNNNNNNVKNNNHKLEMKDTTSQSSSSLSPSSSSVSSSINTPHSASSSSTSSRINSARRKQIYNEIYNSKVPKKRNHFCNKHNSTLFDHIILSNNGNHNNVNIANQHYFLNHNINNIDHQNNNLTNKLSNSVVHNHSIEIQLTPKMNRRSRTLDHELDQLSNNNNYTFQIVSANHGNDGNIGNNFIQIIKSDRENHLFKSHSSNTTFDVIQSYTNNHHSLSNDDLNADHNNDNDNIDSNNDCDGNRNRIYYADTRKVQSEFKAFPNFCINIDFKNSNTDDDDDDDDDHETDFGNHHNNDIQSHPNHHHQHVKPKKKKLIIPKLQLNFHNIDSSISSSTSSSSFNNNSVQLNNDDNHHHQNQNNFKNGKNSTRIREINDEINNNNNHHQQNNISLPSHRNKQIQIPKLKLNFNDDPKMNADDKEDDRNIGDEEVNKRRNKNKYKKKEKVIPQTSRPHHHHHRHHRQKNRSKNNDDNNEDDNNNNEEVKKRKDDNKEKKKKKKKKKEFTKTQSLFPLTPQLLDSSNRPPPSSRHHHHNNNNSTATTTLHNNNNNNNNNNSNNRLSFNIDINLLKNNTKTNKINNNNNNNNNQLAINHIPERSVVSASTTKSSPPVLSSPRHPSFANLADRIRYYDAICSQITNDIYLGSNTIAKDLEKLKSFGITHVLNCAASVCDNYFPNSFHYKSIKLRDISSEDISSLFYDILDYIQSVIQSNGKIFIHCFQGVSRSSSMVILYLMWKNKTKFQETHEYVKRIREIANPNAGFICQLLLFFQRKKVSPPSPILYQIVTHISSEDLIGLQYCEKSIASLDDSFCYLLQSSENIIYLWKGAHLQNIAYLEYAFIYADRIQRFEEFKAEIIIEESGNESDAFKELLLLRSSYSTSVPSTSPPTSSASSPSLTLKQSEKKKKSM